MISRMWILSSHSTWAACRILLKIPHAKFGWPQSGERETKKRFPIVVKTNYAKDANDTFPCQRAKLHTIYILRCVHAVHVMERTPPINHRTKWRPGTCQLHHCLRRHHLQGAVSPCRVDSKDELTIRSRSLRNSSNISSNIRIQILK